MEGKIEIIATEEGIGTKVDVRNVTMLDKYHVLYIIERMFNLTEQDLAFYNVLGRTAVKRNATTIFGKLKPNENGGDDE